MTPERWQQITTLLRSALELEPSLRPAFLDEACRGDADLRREVESYLVAHERAASFMEGPAWKAAPPLGADDLCASVVGRRIGPYKVLREVGHGGMGAVYLAERVDAEFCKQVAIKLVPRGLGSETLLRRFRHERQILADLDHPNIAKLLDGGTTEDGLPYLIMDYVEGQPIDEYCDTHQLSMTDRLKLFRTVCTAVQYAHQHQVVHRDLKPSNILVTAEGAPKLLDFGIAKLLNTESAKQTIEPAAGMLRPMTPEYASPEQVRGSAITPASDVYSLGVLLYELLTGHRPYRVATPTPEEIERVICEEEPEKPSAIVRQRIEGGTKGEGRRIKGEEQNTVPGVAATGSVSALIPHPSSLSKVLAGDLDHIVLMALRKEPARRYASVEAFSEDIRRHLEGQTVVARPDSLSYRTVKFIRRHQAGALVTASVVVLWLTLIGVGVYWFPRRDARVDKAISALAVLPLENFSRDPEQEYFADGMTEALIADLAQIGALQVTSRTSVMAYKGARRPLPEIGRALKVDAIIEGSVLRAGDRVRIAVQLIHAATDRHLWAKTYERDLRDVLVLQKEVAQAIAQEIRIKLTPQEQTRMASARPVHQGAYEAYLKGRHNFWDRWTKEGLKTAIQYFEQAIKEDPSYAPAYAGLADCYSLGIFRERSWPAQEAMSKAKEAARKALALDDQLAEAHAAMALVRFRYDWDWPEAEREYQRAIELSPNYAWAYDGYALYLAMMGRPDEAIAMAQRAQGLDPLSVLINTNEALVFSWARRDDEAINQYRKAIALDPNFPPAYLWLASIYVRKGMYDEALTAFLKGESLSGASPETIAALREAYAASGIKGYWRKRIDLIKGQTSGNDVASYDLAKLYGWLGEKDSAFEGLEKAYAARSPALVNIKVIGEWDSLRSDPRFADLLRRMRLPP